MAPVSSDFNLSVGDANIVGGEEAMIDLGFPEVGRCDVGCRRDNRYAISVPAVEPGRREAEMVLSDYKVGAGLAVSDMGRARDFYEGKLGLRAAIDSPGFVQYCCAEDSLFSIYLSPEHAGKSTATLASWGVEGIEGIVEELTRRGVVFERYDEPGLKTDGRGIATFEGDAKVAYFKDPDVHTLSIAQPPRS